VHIRTIGERLKGKMQGKADLEKQIDPRLRISFICNISFESGVLKDF